MRGRDRAIGIVLGLLLGIAIVVAFVFLGSGDTIDDAALNDGTQPPAERSVPATTEADPR